MEELGIFLSSAIFIWASLRVRGDIKLFAMKSDMTLSWTLLQPNKCPHIFRSRVSEKPVFTLDSEIHVEIHTEYPIVRALA